MAAIVADGRGFGGVGPDMLQSRLPAAWGMTNERQENRRRGFDSSGYSLAPICAGNQFQRSTAAIILGSGPLRWRCHHRLGNRANLDGPKAIIVMRLRFTVRDLLWLTLVVALSVGWWVDHRRNTALNQPAIKLHYFANLRASDVAALFSAAFAGTPGVRFSADERLNAIVLECPIGQQKGIDELMDKLDQPQPDTSNTMTPEQMQEFLKSLIPKSVAPDEPPAGSDSSSKEQTR